MVELRPSTNEERNDFIPPSIEHSAACCPNWPVTNKDNKQFGNMCQCDANLSNIGPRSVRPAHPCVTSLSTRPLSFSNLTQNSS